MSQSWMQASANHDQFIEAMLDSKTWLLFTFAVSSNCPNGGLTNV